MSSFQDQQIMNPSIKDEQDFLLAMELSTVSILPMTMKAAIELGVLEILAKATPTQLSSSEIASQLPTNNQEAPVILDRILRLLASHSLLTCNLVSSNNDGNVQRVYGLASVCRYFVPNEEGVSLAPFLFLSQDKVSMELWYHLKDAILEGVLPFMRAHNGMHAFEYSAKDARLHNLFNQSMHNHTIIVMKKILQVYNGFEGLNQLVDVAGGLGANLSLIVDKYPQIKGINFDLPIVVQDASSRPGVEHVGGDMFVEVPEGQAIFMKWILHDWGDDRCLKILKNCYDALPDSGKVIVVESIVSEFPETDIVSKNISRLDICVSNLFPGAKERTLEEFKSLATIAGFAAIKIICQAYCYWVIEFYKTVSPI